MQQSFPKQKRGFRILNEMYMFLMKYKHIEFLDEIYIYFSGNLSFSTYPNIYEKSYFLPPVPETSMTVSGVRNVFFPETFVHVLNCHLLGKISLFFPDVISHFIHCKCQVDFIFVQD